MKTKMVHSLLAVLHCFAHVLIRQRASTKLPLLSKTFSNQRFQNSKNPECCHLWISSTAVARWLQSMYAHLDTAPCYTLKCSMQVLKLQGSLCKKCSSLLHTSWLSFTLICSNHDLWSLATIKVHTLICSSTSHERWTMEKRVGKNIVICRTGTCKFDHEHFVLPATLS